MPSSAAFCAAVAWEKTSRAWPYRRAQSMLTGVATCLPAAIGSASGTAMSLRTFRAWLRRFVSEAAASCRPIPGRSPGQAHALRSAFGVMTWFPGAWGVDFFDMAQRLAVPPLLCQGRRRIFWREWTRRGYDAPHVAFAEGQEGLLQPLQSGAAAQTRGSAKCRHRQPVKDEPVRGLNWADRLAQIIEFSSTGDPASGTAGVGAVYGAAGLGEIDRTSASQSAARTAGRTGWANLLTVLISAEQLLICRPPSTFRTSTCRFCSRWNARYCRAEGKDPNDAMKDGIWTRVASPFDGDLSLDAKASLAYLGGASLALEMKENPDIRLEVRRQVERSTSRFLRLCHTELKTSVTGARQRAGGHRRDHDSLEKLRGITANFNDVLRSAEQLFAGSHSTCSFPSIRSLLCRLR